MADDQVFDRVQIVNVYRRFILPGRMRHSGSMPDNIGPHTVDTDGNTAMCYFEADVFAADNTIEPGDSLFDSMPNLLLPWFVLNAKFPWITIKGLAQFHDSHTFLRGVVLLDSNQQAESVEQLRAQLTLVGIHRAEQNKPGFVDVTDAIAFDTVDATGGNIQQQIDQVIRQQVDLIYIEDPLVRFCP